MCTFMSSLPRVSTTAGIKKRNLLLPIKPTEKDVYYRFRLLAFNGVGTTRDYPFITRFVHHHWGTTDTGKPIVDDQVVCPVTPWVKVDGDKYDACPICKLSNQNYIVYKESGFKNKDARKKNKEYSRVFEAIIPVYVVNDPVYTGNNNKFKVLIINNKDKYKEFLAKVEANSKVVNVFNGGEGAEPAVDCCIHMSEVEKIYNEGLPNEIKFMTKDIDRIVFTKKAYTIDAITKDAVDNMGFDEEYYQSSTPEEIEKYYKKYCMMSNDDIPLEDEIPVIEPPKPAKSTAAKKISTQNEQRSNVVSTNEIPTEDVDSIINETTSSDVPEVLSEKSVSDLGQNNLESTDDLDDLLAGIDDLV